MKKANNPDIQVPDSENMNFADEITVEAWVYSDIYQTEALQPIVSKWLLNTTFNSFEAYDAGNTDGMKTIGYFGSIFDGRYVYFSPQRDGGDYHSVHGRVLRYDTRGDFKDPKSYAAYDAGNTDGLNTKGYYGAVFDGRFVYFVPRGKNYFDFNEFHSRVLRYDTHMDFKSSSSWDAYDVGLDQTQQSAAFDGRYIYFVPYGNSSVVRYDIYSDFNDVNSWHVYDAGNLGGVATDGFDGGFFDGRYVYFEPFSLKKREGIKDRFHSNFVRYDTQGSFDDTKSWVSFNAGRTDNLETIGYNGGAFDGRYYYLAPCFEKDYVSGLHGRILRYDTLGENGTFSLRYCDYGHNGGLNGAVSGSSFLINTVKGPVSIFANKALVPGWHHIAGVYNGDTIKLFIDGILVNESQSGIEITCI